MLLCFLLLFSEDYARENEKKFAVTSEAVWRKECRHIKQHIATSKKRKLDDRLRQALYMAQNLSRLVSHWTDRLIFLDSDWLFTRLQKTGANKRAKCEKSVGTCERGGYVWNCALQLSPGSTEVLLL